MPYEKYYWEFPENGKTITEQLSALTYPDGSQMVTVSRLEGPTSSMGVCTFMVDAEGNYMEAGEPEISNMPEGWQPPTMAKSHERAKG